MAARKRTPRPKDLIAKGDAWKVRYRHPRPVLGGLWTTPAKIKVRPTWGLLFKSRFECPSFTFKADTIVKVRYARPGLNHPGQLRLIGPEVRGRLKKLQRIPAGYDPRVQPFSMFNGAGFRQIRAQGINKHGWEAVP